MYEWIGKITGNTLATRRFAMLFRLLPQSLVLVLCKGMGCILYCLAGDKLRSKIGRNMLELLPDRSDKDRSSYSLQFFQNLLITLYELLLDSYQLQGSEAWRFCVKGEKHLEEALSMGRGAIVYSPHVGNFFYYYWYLCQKYACLTIATSGSSELRPLYLRFKDLGCPGLDYDSTPPLELLRKLRKHLSGNGVVYILGDFWRPTFPESYFFGKKTRTPEGAASLAIEHQVPLVPFYGRRLKGFTHELIFEQPLQLYDLYSRSQRAEATLMLNHHMERVIRKYPAQWFYWFNAEERWEKDKAADLKLAKAE
ncbi:lysophospholipid acyltransferase family protein [Paenibacillus radicis (ex Xue et al. 2023)]|uniref:Lysophospholipid acyltransferase family protein n=1 Tax=Paenibacillus radicis (ex Xue et al. 2023) TaxID=2972489 RepID=A0ABT1YFB9_9BACL|nr:lysophospholipid acyltransferase family protein [Paenibacillus radicis (ex Xue et al. 2023)]MCR8631891.1 lysophospholipid acyltransferase family protein [Paenibacillus radicis (ex Xue et al. 2023)]